MHNNSIEIYIPHYTALTERVQPLQKQLNKLPWFANWIYSYDADDSILNDALRWRHYDYGDNWEEKIAIFNYGCEIPSRVLSKSEISLALKHIRAWEAFINNCTNHNYAIILEDDVVLSERFEHEIMTRIIPSMEDNYYGIIFLGESECAASYLHSLNGIKTVRYNTPGSRTTDGYILSKFYAQQLFKNILPFSLPIDFEMSYLMNRLGLNIGHLEKPIIRQGIYKSSIQE